MSSLLAAESLGGVETLISLPDDDPCFHAKEVQDRSASPRMVRLSVGIEDVEDIIAISTRHCFTCSLQLVLLS